MITRRRRAGGFTLIEVMIALVLMLSVATALWRSMSLTFGTKSRIETLNDRYHEGRQVINRLAREVRTALLIAEVPQQLRDGDKPAVVTEFVGEEDEIYFATTSHLRFQAESRESDQAEVAYFLKTGDRRSDYEGKTLYRRESRFIDDQPDRGGAVWPVIEGVKELKLEYWDEAKQVGDDAWERSWDSKDNQVLPRRVRITLVLDGGKDGRPLRFVTQAAPRIRRPIAVLDAHRRGPGGQVRQPGQPAGGPADGFDEPEPGQGAQGGRGGAGAGRQPGLDPAARPGGPRRADDLINFGGGNK